MPPKRGAADARKRENMYFEPGVRGRKTGLTVPDTGIRDEMGMEPIDDLFSSPEKTIVVGPPAMRAPAMTAEIASARKPAPGRAPAAAPRTVKKQTEVQKEAQAPQAQMQPSPALQPRPKQARSQMQPHQQQQDDTPRKISAADETNSMEESMQIGNSTMPEPTAVLTERRKSMHAPLPRSISPKKTFLGSPARRHPSIQPGESSPTRGMIMSPPERMEKETVARKLDFSRPNDDVFAPQSQLQTQNLQAAVPKSPAPAAASKAPVKTPSAANGKRKRASLEKENLSSDQTGPENLPAPPDSVRSHPGAWEEPTPFPSQKKSDRSFDLSPTSGLVGDEEYQPMLGDEDEVMEDNFEQLLERTATPPEDSPAPPAKAATKKKVRTSLEKQKGTEKDKGKAKEAAIVAPLAEKEKKKAGRAKSKETEKEAVIPMAQAEQYLEIEASRIYSEDEGPALPPLKRSKLSSKDINRKISIKKATQLAKDVESSPVQIQRGPPRPRANGLFILRRETPGVGSFATSRVGLGMAMGRPKAQPAVRWGNEDTYVEDDQDAPPSRQAVHREEALDDTPQFKKKSKREIQEEEAEELAETWESEPGRVNGMVKEWSGSKDGADGAEKEDEIAFSGPAIITRPIPNSDVQFAKTLTLPFFGSGMVDLPPGAIKRPKNSRKMQMVFFVFKGNVKVTVNENTFRISAGGMWQVPRGNMYSIENDYEKEARIFFSQGCEVTKED